MQIKFDKRMPKTRHRNALEKVTTIPEAVHKLFSSLPLLSAAIAAASVIGYLISWNMLEVYYSEIGINWYIRTLQPTTVLLSGTKVYISLASVAFFSLILIMKGISTKKMTVVAAISGALGIVLQYGSILAEGHYSDSNLRLLSGVGTVFGYIAAGMMIAELISSLKDSKLVWGAGHLALISVFYFSVLMPNVRNTEAQRAKAEMNSATSNLPYAEKRNCAECIWRILNLDNGKALLVRISTIKEDRRFMLVTLDENWEIAPSGSTGYVSTVLKRTLPAQD